MLENSSWIPAAHRMKSQRPSSTMSCFPQAHTTAAHPVRTVNAGLPWRALLTPFTASLWLTVPSAPGRQGRTCASWRIQLPAPPPRPLFKPYPWLCQSPIPLFHPCLAICLLTFRPGLKWTLCLDNENIPDKHVEHSTLKILSGPPRDSTEHVREFPVSHSQSIVVLDSDPAGSAPGPVPMTAVPRCLQRSGHEAHCGPLFGSMEGLLLPRQKFSHSSAILNTRNNPQRLSSHTFLRFKLFALRCNY